MKFFSLFCTSVVLAISEDLLPDTSQLSFDQIFKMLRKMEAEYYSELPTKLIHTHILIV